MSNEQIIEYFVRKYDNSIRPLLLNALNFADQLEKEHKFVKPFNRFNYIKNLLGKKYRVKDETGRY
jgi:hypothetical protein